MNDKAFLPPVVDLPYTYDSRDYAKTAVIIACHAAQGGGVGVALELGDILGVSACSWQDGRDLLITEREARDVRE